MPSHLLAAVVALASSRLRRGAGNRSRHGPKTSPTAAGSSSVCQPASLTRDSGKC